MATIERELTPWRAPNFAHVQRGPGSRSEGYKESEAIPVAELPHAALNELAGEWLNDLYKKAGIPSPWKNMG